MRILLINPPYVNISTSKGVGHQTPLGLLCLGGPLIDAGHTVRLYDAELHHATDAMLAEAVHSAADCANQLLLLLGIRQARRQPTPDHPLGFGKATYFWSFMVAIMLFSLGGAFSPMHIPVLLCGLVCGWPYGAFCGIAGPILSSLVAGMPGSAMLLYMVPELLVYGLTAGLLMKLISIKKIGTAISTKRPTATLRRISLLFSTARPRGGSKRLIIRERF